MTLGDQRQLLLGFIQWGDRPPAGLRCFLLWQESETGASLVFVPGKGVLCSGVEFQSDAFCCAKQLIKEVFNCRMAFHLSKRCGFVLLMQMIFQGSYPGATASCHVNMLKTNTSAMFHQRMLNGEKQHGAADSRLRSRLLLTISYREASSLPDAA